MMPKSDGLYLGSKGRQASRRWVRRGALIVAGAFVCGLVAYLIFLRMTRIDPPPIAPAVRAAAELPLEVRGPRAYVGESWLGRERGI